MQKQFQLFQWRSGILKVSSGCFHFGLISRNFLVSQVSRSFPSSREDNSWPVGCQDLQTRITLWIGHWGTQNFRGTPHFSCHLPFHGPRPSWPVSSVWHRQLKLTLWHHCRPSHNLIVCRLCRPADCIHQVLLLWFVSARSLALWYSCFKPNHYWYDWSSFHSCFFPNSELIFPARVKLQIH